MNLIYELSTINRQTLGNEFVYRMNRFRKIDEAKDKMGRPYYHGVVKKKMRQIASMYMRWVYDKGAVQLIQNQLQALKAKQVQSF